MFRSFLFFSFFMWGGISLIENDLEWQFERKRHQKGFSFAGSHLTCQKFIWSEDFPFFFLLLIGNYFVFLRFPFYFFRSSIGNPSFPFFSFIPFPYFHFFLFLSFHFFFSIPFFGKSGFSILFALP